MQGRIKFFNQERMFGFIIGDDRDDKDIGRNKVSREGTPALSPERALAQGTLFLSSVVKNE